MRKTHITYTSKQCRNPSVFVINHDYTQKQRMKKFTYQFCWDQTPTKPVQERRGKKEWFFRQWIERVDRACRFGPLREGRWRWHIYTRFCKSLRQLRRTIKPAPTLKYPFHKSKASITVTMDFEQILLPTKTKNKETIKAKYTHP